MELRPYQEDAIEALREKFRRGARKVLLISPTGSGKTVTFCHIVSRAVEKGSRALILAHRRELVTQASQKLNAYDVPHGIIQAGFRPAPQRPVQVASVQTLARREGPEQVDIIIIDEAHHTTEANTYGKLLARWPNAVVLGVTATPWRLDGRGLADIFPEHVVAATPRELRDKGYLVPVGGWEYEAVDTTGARVQGGDFVAGDLRASATSRRVVGNVVQEWLEHAAGRRTVCFAISVEQSKLLVDAFRAEGVRAEHLDGETPAAEREGILARLNAGEVHVVSNCAVLTEGWDCPAAEVAVLASPTLSTVKALQMIGRVLRPSPGKERARIHDHAGVLAMHGHPYAERDYSPQRSTKGDRQKAQKPAARCPSCKSVVSGRWPCDSCGWSPTPAELQLELEAERRAKAQAQLQLQYEEAARRKAILDDAAHRPQVDPESDAGRRLRWASDYMGPKNEHKRRDFWERMVVKHGQQKARWVYWWFSGKTERPPQAWLRPPRQGAPAA